MASLLIGVLALVAAAFAYRRRITRGRPGSALSDEQIDRIVAEGTVDVDDEPLDLDSIRKEERDFWAETWDEPEEL